MLRTLVYINVALLLLVGLLMPAHASECCYRAGYSSMHAWAGEVHANSRRELRLYRTGERECLEAARAAADALGTRDWSCRSVIRISTPADWQPDYCQVPAHNYFLPCHEIEPDMIET